MVSNSKRKNTQPTGDNTAKLALKISVMAVIMFAIGGGVPLGLALFGYLNQ
ncbi:hypothetical protein GCM10008915_75700 [Bifidobacterium pullorum subsp. gallinarum]|jgi:hypothetical protein